MKTQVHVSKRRASVRRLKEASAVYVSIDEYGAIASLSPAKSYGAVAVHATAYVHDDSDASTQAGDFSCTHGFGIFHFQRFPPAMLSFVRPAFRTSVADAMTISARVSSR